jgi:hypothetical protein
MMAGLLDGLVMCAAHLCPIFLIGEDYWCVLEYTDEQIGLETVTGIKWEDDCGLLMSFSNGCLLPLIHPEWGLPYPIETADSFYQLRGLRVVALRYIGPEDEIYDFPEGALIVLLAPAGTDMCDLTVERLLALPRIALHLESVRGITRAALVEQRAL